MAYILAGLCTLLMIFGLLLILPGLPGNWVIIGIAAVWAYFSDTVSLTWQYFAFIVGLAAGGEIVESLAGHFGAKRFGGSSQGGYGGIVGALAGGILGAAFLFGVGALPGALAGGFLGCFIVEKGRGMETSPALRSAWGATLGRFGGFVVKFGIGIVILWTALPRLWEGV